MELDKVTGARIFMEMKDGSMSYDMLLKKDPKTKEVKYTLTTGDDSSKSVKVNEKCFEALIKVIEKNNLLTWKPGKVGINTTPFEEGFEIFCEGNRSREFVWDQPYENLIEPSNLIDFLFSLKTLVPGVKDHHDHGGGGCCGGHDHDHHHHDDHSKEEKTEEKKKDCGKDCKCSEEKKEKKESCCGGKCDHHH